MKEDEKQGLRVLSSLRNMSQREITQWRCNQLQSIYQRHPNDTGSSEVQSALLAFFLPCL